MLLDLKKIRTARERYEKTYPADACAGERESFRIVAPAALEFDIFKDKQHVRLIGTVKTTLELTCSRCLEPFEMAVEAPFDLRYQPHAQNVGSASGEEREIEEDDLSTAFYTDDRIDLGQLMREQFYLSVPMKPLCRDDCRGLCVVCGTNLNRDACECKREWSDPRLAALKVLKDVHHKGH